MGVDLCAVELARRRELSGELPIVMKDVRMSLRGLV
jgi:hypothetical protein